VVIDMWFSAQALSPLPEALERVEALLDHPLFSLSTPNKVRALIGSFAQSNQVQFNRADGAGYRFVADQCLALDRFNPQLAARILNAFRSWRSLEPKRRHLAKQVLQRIAKTEGLSRDVFEIASKMLQKHTFGRP
jgi:aminopeptidase N